MNTGEGMARSDVNNAIRKQMADIKDFSLTVPLIADQATVNAGTNAVKSVSPLTLAKAIQANVFGYASALGTTPATANAQTLTLTPALTALTVGTYIPAVAIVTDNTGAMTLNINGLGAKPVLFAGAALAAGAWKGGRFVSLVYDGTSLQILTPTIAAGPVVVSKVTNANGVAELWSDGTIKQWGALASSGGGFSITKTITFPVSFTVIPPGVLATNNGPSMAVAYCTARALTTANITLDNTQGAGGISASVIAWEAISS